MVKKIPWGGQQICCLRWAHQPQWPSQQCLLLFESQIPNLPWLSSFLHACNIHAYILTKPHPPKIASNLGRCKVTSNTLLLLWSLQTFHNPSYVPTGCLKKNVPVFILQIFRKPSIGFSNCFFLLETEIHTQILNTKPFLCNIRGPRFYKTKCGSETDQFIIILPHSDLKPQ